MPGFPHYPTPSNSRLCAGCGQPAEMKQVAYSLQRVKVCPRCDEPDPKLTIHEMPGWWDVA